VAINIQNGNIVSWNGWKYHIAKGKTRANAGLDRSVDYLVITPLDYRD